MKFIGMMKNGRETSGKDFYQHLILLILSVLEEVREGEA